MSAVVDSNPTHGRKPEDPVFDHSKVTVIFVLGGPGAGEMVRNCICICFIIQSRKGNAVRQARPRNWVLPSLWYDLMPSRTTR
jgi:hypothetical protein